MKILLTSIFLVCLFSCVSKARNTSNTALVADVNEPVAAAAMARQFKGALIGGFKGDSIFFTVSADGKKLENLTFKGYWRCSGKLEQLAAVGPEGSFPVVNGKAKGHISDPPDGGATAWRFDIDATVDGNTASGTFRMNINNLGCDTYRLKFEAKAVGR